MTQLAVRNELVYIRKAFNHSIFVRTRSGMVRAYRERHRARAGGAAVARTECNLG